MPIELPDFKNTHCVSFTACAEIQDADRSLKNWLKKEADTISVFNTALGKTFLRVGYGGRSDNHLHIDVGQSSVFTEEFMPKVRRTIPVVQKKLERLTGRQVKVGLAGLFVAKLDELPPSGIIRTLFFETKIGNVGIKTEGARFSITGAPVERISWYVRSKTEIGVVLDSADLKREFCESYLMAGLDTLESAFNAFILGKNTNEPK